MVRRSILFALLAVALLAPPVRAAAPSPYLQIAEQGAAQAQRLWWDKRHHSYDERLNDHDRYPLATIWDALPLFETVDAIQIAAPTPAHRAAVERFVRGAERYWDRGLRPHPGYAPYPGDRGAHVRVWFDDNGWWGNAFLDAYRATHDPRALRDAQRALAFIEASGWDSRNGGLWWNTSHPYKAGEALAAGTLLAARLYQATYRSSYLAFAKQLMSWGDRAMWIQRDGLYAASDTSPISMPYVEGPMIAAHEILCLASGDRSLCSRAETLAHNALDRFGDNLEMGPQFDAIYVHWMLDLYSHDGNPALYRLATTSAQRALANARDASGLFTRAWDGSPMTQHQSGPGMLQAQAASVSVFGWLATVAPPA